MIVDKSESFGFDQETLAWRLAVVNESSDGLDGGVESTDVVVVGTVSFDTEVVEVELVELVEGTVVGGGSSSDGV